MPHSLLSTERHVPLDRTELYHRLWQRLRRQAEAAGLRAWRFRAARREDRFLEFLESSEASALQDPTILATLQIMQQQVGSVQSRRWEEVTGDE